jgi:hypothetical protein
VHLVWNTFSLLLDEELKESLLSKDAMKQTTNLNKNNHPNLKGNPKKVQPFFEKILYKIFKKLLKQT